AGLFTAWAEWHLIGVERAPFDLSLLQRAVLAGRIIWFYVGKLVWPANLIFIYPRWEILPAITSSILYPLAVVAVVAGLWMIRRRSRAPLVGFLFFVGSLFPALGFVDVYPFTFSFVADHFQYLASIGIIALAAAAASLAVDRLAPLRRPLGYAACGVLVATLGILTARQSWMYRDAETLYQTTISRNPQCWLAYNNLGQLMVQANRPQDAVPSFEHAIELIPPGGHMAVIQTNLGSALLESGRRDEAIIHLRRATTLAPGYAEAHKHLGVGLLGSGQPREAITELQEAVRLESDYLEARYALATALLATGRLAGAISQYRAVLATQPDFAEAHSFLADALMATGQSRDAVAHYQRAVQLKSDLPSACNNLAWIYATSEDAQLRNPAEAIRLALKAVELSGGKDPTYLDTLAAAYAGSGKLAEAVTTAEKALEMAQSAQNEPLAKGIGERLESYRQRQKPK
ncbi:MAG TPA: tetratricopeptide repeat protein, partial [Tepidisphaeraceae bacterium]